MCPPFRPIVAAAMACADVRAPGANWPLAISLDVVLLGVVSDDRRVRAHRLASRDRCGGVGSGSGAAAAVSGVPLGSMVAIRELRGPQVLFLMMLTVFVSDSAQVLLRPGVWPTSAGPGHQSEENDRGCRRRVHLRRHFFHRCRRMVAAGVPAAGRVVIGVAIVIARNCRRLVRIDVETKRRRER